MKYYNQNNYSHVPYPSKNSPNATIKSGGCGVCSSTNVLNFYGYNCTPKDIAKEFIEQGARVNGGTNMYTAAKIICKLGDLEYKTTNDEKELWEHVKKGGIAIANVDGDVGAKGIFSSAGHYINIVGIESDRLKIFDVGYYSGKFSSAYRSKYITLITDDEGNKFQLCTQATLNIDTANRNPQYFLFTQKEQEDDKMLKDLYNKYGEVAVKEAIEKLILQEQNKEQVSTWGQNVFYKTTKTDNPLIKGDGKGNYDWQTPVTLERLMVILDKMGLIK